MLSVIRRALGQSCRSATRGLSTVVNVESPVVINPVEQGLAGSSVQLSNVTLPEASLEPSTALSPFARPVYLTMSSFIPPSEDAAAEAENIVELDPFIFSHPIRRDILHLCVVHHLDSLRQGSASTKTRGEVRGSGRKIRPQKGTGRARLGDGQSPMLRGGGVAFGPKPRDFSTKLNRKVIQMGMRVALSARVKEQSLGVVENLDWPTAKTKELSARIEALGWRKTLLVSGNESVPENLKKAGSNIPNLEIVTAQDLKVYDVVRWPRVILDLAAVEWLERTLGKPVAQPRKYEF